MNKVHKISYVYIDSNTPCILGLKTGLLYYMRQIVYKKTFYKHK